MITAMPRIAIAVRDMDRAIATFRDGLGMPVYEFQWLREALGIRMSLYVWDGFRRFSGGAAPQPRPAPAATGGED